MTTGAGAHDQQLVLYYAASVFMSFLVGPMAMARFTRQERRHTSSVINLIAPTIITNPVRRTDTHLDLTHSLYPQTLQGAA